MMETSLGLPQKSWEISGHFWKMSGNVHLAFGTILENLSEIFKSGQKSLKNDQKPHPQYVYLMKRTLHVSSKIGMLCSCGKNNIS